MIQAVVDVARPVASLVFLIITGVTVDWLIRADSRRIHDRNTRRLFEGNRQPNEFPGALPRTAPVLRENARSKSA